MTQQQMKLKNFFFLSVLFLFGCKENFEVWKNYNEDYLTTQTSEYKLNTFDEGLRYKIIFQGKGATPKQNSIVKINYSATLCDGTTCTSLDTVDYVYNYPIGVQNALLRMNRESIWQLCIPYELAYGVSGTKNTYGNYIIPPYSTIFIKRLELKEVVNN